MESFSLAAPDGVALYVRRWEPDAPPRMAVQIVHGLAEHGGRYAGLAEALTRAGAVVYAGDLRGHGRTAAGPGELGFFAERDGWPKCVGDLELLRRRIAAEHPKIPLVLIAHSLGSLLAQDFLVEHGHALAGAVLSGSNGKPPLLAAAGRWLARGERLRLGPRGRSALIHRLAFGAYNRTFEPARTPFDWLSRDPAEIDAYRHDPLCGFVATVQLWADVLAALPRLTRPARLARLPRALPIHLIAGTRDPVSNGTRALRSLLAAYRAAGLSRVSHRFYEGARHELFHESNRDAVIADLLSWLDDLARHGSLEPRQGDG